MADLKAVSEELYNVLKDNFRGVGIRKRIMINGVILTNHSFSNRTLHGSSYYNTSKEAVLNELQLGSEGKTPRESYYPYTLNFDGTVFSLYRDDKSSKTRKNPSQDCGYLWESIADYIFNDKLENYFSENMIISDAYSKTPAIRIINAYNIIHIMSAEYKMFYDVSNLYKYDSDNSIRINYENEVLRIPNTILINQMLQKNDMLREHLMKAYIINYNAILTREFKFADSYIFTMSGMFCPVRISVKDVIPSVDLYDFYFSDRLDLVDYKEFANDTIYFDREGRTAVKNAMGRTGSPEDGSYDFIVYRTHKEICKFLGINFIPFTPKLLFTVLSKNMDNTVIAVEANSSGLSKPLVFDGVEYIYRKRVKEADGSFSYNDITVPAGLVLKVNRMFLTILSEAKELRKLAGGVYDRFVSTFDSGKYEAVYSTKDPYVAYTYILYYRELADKVLKL